MIIPKISATEFPPDEQGQLDLVEAIRFWSLFGKIALTDVDNLALDQWESIV